MNGYRVDLEQLRLLVDAAADLDRRIEDRLRAIQHQVEALYLHWTGNAADAHQDFIVRWLRDARDMRAALVVLQSATARAHSTYTGVVDTNQWMWPD